MNDVYLICDLTKQAHHQALEREKTWTKKTESYIRLMHGVRELHPGMGLRTMHEMTQPEGIGRDSFIALGLTAGFRLQTVSNPTRTTFSTPSRRYSNLLRGLEFTDVNQIWTSDITYFQHNEKYWYIVLIMDVYSRRLIGWSMADNMRAENNLKALKMALKTRGIKNYDNTLIHHSDRGSQYISDIYTRLLTDSGVLISMCNEVYENTHIERANNTVKNQYLALYDIPNENALPKCLDKGVNLYNSQRPHQALNGLSPIKFENNLKELKTNERYPLKIYTVPKQNDSKLDKNQLTLEF